MAAALSPAHRRPAPDGGGPVRRSAALPVALLLLVGCAGPGATPRPETATDLPGATPSRTADAPAGAGNPIDVMFLQMTLEQHDRAAAVLRLAADRARRPEVRTLAAAMAATQRTEAQTMTAWLRDWGRPLAADPAAHRAHGAHGGYDVLRGTTEAEIDLLASVDPDEFDRTLLNVLVAHQHNAVELARMQRAGGAQPGVTRFAELIDRSRTAQIAHLLTLLAGAAGAAGAGGGPAPSAGQGTQ